MRETKRTSFRVVDDFDKEVPFLQQSLKGRLEFVSILFNETGHIVRHMSGVVLHNEQQGELQETIVTSVPRETVLVESRVLQVEKRHTNTIWHNVFETGEPCDYEPVVFIPNTHEKACRVERSFVLAQCFTTNNTGELQEAIVAHRPRGKSNCTHKKRVFDNEKPRELQETIISSSLYAKWGRIGNAACYNHRPRCVEPNIKTTCSNTTKLEAGVGVQVECAFPRALLWSRKVLKCAAHLNVNQYA